MEYIIKGISIQIDSEDFDRISAKNWHIKSDGVEKYGAYYFISSMPLEQRRLLGIKHKKKISLHRFIMNCPLDKVVDHKNGDTLDNRKDNLRICNKHDNDRNVRKKRTSANGPLKSTFKGVNVNIQWTKPYYSARITYNRKAIHLGSFPTEIDAAKAYDKAAKQYFGEFARLNFPEENYEI